MDDRMMIRCPNCGSFAHRLLSDCLPTGDKCPANQIMQTECPVCDYFMVTCWQTGAVLEAYAPGRYEATATTTTTSKPPIVLLPVSSVLPLAPSKLLTGQS
jgi:hypothetical protein